MSDTTHWRQLEDLVHAALERGEAERAAFLDAACGANADLRREVETLLARERSADGFLDAGVGPMAAAVLGGPARSVVGRRIGPFEIVAPLGAGGMGEVYRARDTELGREVAIKVLPQAFVADRDRLARFAREARVLAALNHPHIGAIYGLETFDGARALILELVSGDTLADRIAKAGGQGRGAGLPVGEALHLARQIADALDAAHEKGIVHRDLKPANVKVTPEGVAKVLDFGLAKGGDHAAADSSRSPTVSIDGTREGQVIGTVAYMSPEQARGLTVDKRTDIWALGCVLYEMLTGRRAFAGATTSDHLVAILEREPDWTALPPATPPAIRRLLRRCLEKDPKRRLRDIADVRAEIEDATTSPDGAVTSLSDDGRTGRGPGFWVWGIACAVCALVGVLFTWAIMRAGSRPVLPTTRSVVTLPPSSVLAETISRAVALSPDGRMLAFAAVTGERSRIFIRPIDALTATPVAGSEGAPAGVRAAHAPVFSPDGQWLAFVADGMLKKVAISGGASQNLGPAAGLKSVLWTDDNRLVFNALPESGLVAMSAAGGTRTPVTVADVEAGEVTHRGAEALPGGALLMAVGLADMASQDESRIDAFVPATGQRKVLVHGGMQPRYLPTGHLVYARAGTLVAARIDARRLEIVGAPVTVADNVNTDPVWGFANYAVSNNGLLAYVAGGANAHEASLVWVDRQGRQQPAAQVRRNFVQVRASPDGRGAALTVDAGNAEIWIYDLARATWSRLVHGWNNSTPAWSTDGTRIAFGSGRPPKEGGPGVYSQATDGTGTATKLIDGVQYPGAWSPGDRYLLITTQQGSDLAYWSASDQQVHPLTQSPATDGSPRLSPDGRWVVYSSDQTGRDEVYARRFPDPSREWQVSRDGGGFPVWSADGRQVFYREGSKMMAVEVSEGAGFTSGQPKMLFDDPNLVSAFGSYDVVGDRFLMIRREPRIFSELVLVQNWFEELQARLPDK